MLPPLDKILRNTLTLLMQIFLLGLISWSLAHVFNNVQENLQTRGIHFGFSFLEDTAGFSIIFHLIHYDEFSHYWRVFWVGVLNTLMVSGIGLVLATLIGFLVGLARVSIIKTIAMIATCFVELIRNIPLLLQLFFWYFVVLRAVPYPQNSITLSDTIYMNNRGIYFPWPIFSYFTMSLFLLWSMSLISMLYALRKQKIYLLGTCFVCSFIFCILFFSQTIWEYPVLGKFNFMGGANLIPELVALILALSIYTAAYIAEIVRMGILSVQTGQYEAARSLGLSRYQSLNYIIIPQAMKVILPPLTNQYLNLTKNSSLATAIAFPDLVSIFAGTALNQTGHAVEIILMTMAVYLTINLFLSLMIQIYEKRSAWKSS